MSLPWIPFNSFLARPLDVYLGLGSAPAANGFYLALLLGGTIDATSNLATVLAQEISGFGYVRAHYVPSAGAYDATQIRYEYPPQTLNFTVTGGALQYDKAVLLGGAAATGSSGELIFYQPQPTVVTIADGATEPLQVVFNLGGSAADVNAA